MSKTMRKTNTKALPRVTPGVRVEGEDRSELTVRLAERYVLGASVRQLSEEIGRSYGFVHRILSEARVLRPRGEGQSVNNRYRRGEAPAPA